MLAEGARIDRYELVCPVGEGGMAQVWVASQRGKHGFEKLFALKSIHPRFADDASFRAMFLDEARIASAIQHPNVAQVFDLGEADTLLYLVMEYVEGESLSSLHGSASHRQGGKTPLPTAVALRIAADIAAGLHSAHRLKAPSGELRGVVHRDVSPHNVLVSIQGEVKVIDFGIAHAKDRWGADTDAGGVKGKAGYMAPEQARRQRVSPATDVFGLGCTLYKLLTGHPPFWAGNDVGTLARLLSGPPPDALPESIPPLVRAIVERAIEIDPGDRYDTAQSMQNAIEGAIAEEGFVPNVAGWVTANLSERARERQAQLSKRGSMTTPPETLTPLKRSVDPPAPAPAPGPAAVEVVPPKLPPSVPDLGPLPVKAAPPPSPVPPPPEPIAVQPSSRLRSEEETTKTPGFMDVRALAARVASDPSDRKQYKPPPRAIAALLPPPPPEPPAEAKDAAPPKRDFVPVKPKPKTEIEERGRAWTKLAIGAIAIVLLVVAVLLLLPRIVKDRVIASARSAGVELTIERVGVRFGGVTLYNVNATSSRIPGATAHAEEIVSVGFSAREVRVRGLDLTLEGPLTDTNAAVTRFVEESRAVIAGTASDPRHISIGPAHVTWNGLFGPGTRLAAGDVGLDLETRGVGTEDFHGSIGRFDVTTKRTLFGAWSAAFESNASASRIRLLFDPPVPDGPSMLIVWGKTAPVHVTVKIPRSPLANLGVRPAELSLPADGSTELEMKGEGGKTLGGRIELNVNAELKGGRLPNLKTPIDMKLAASLSGVPGKPLDFERTTITIGPFVVAVMGSVTLANLGFRLDVTWKTLPIPCDKLVRAEAKSWGAFAATIQELAHATGVARFTGTAAASGLVTYDTSAPDDASMTWLTKESCGLSIFGL